MSPKKTNRIILAATRLLVMFGIIGGVYLYQCYSEGKFNGTGNKFKNWLTNFTGTTFEFKPEAVIDKKIRETGKIIYVSGRVSDFENNYTSHEKRTFSNNILTLEGKTEGIFDPILKPLIKGDSYSQQIDTSGSFCPEKFIPHYPLALRGYIYFMPRTPLFDGQKWNINSCGGRFLCTYSASIKERENKINLECSGSIGEAQTAIYGTMKINENFDGFTGIEMDITSENSELQSVWHFYEGIKL